MRRPRGFKLKALTIIALIAVSLTPILLAPSSVEARAEPFPRWIKPGLRVAYGVFAGSVSVSPAASATATLQSGGPWDAPITYQKKPGKVSTTGLFEHYVVTSIEARGVSMYFSLWGYHAAERLEEEIIVPFRRPFNGPFWVDPALLRDAREGSLVTIPWGRQTVRYVVQAAGRYDISPFSKGEDTLTSLMGGIAVSVPVPPKTYRDIVLLQGEIKVRVVEQNQQGQQQVKTRKLFHELVVDRETGLILVEGLVEPQNKPPQNNPQNKPQAGVYGGSVYVRSLAEINIDLEDVLPSYKQRDYNYGPLLHTGYMFGADAMAQYGVSVVVLRHDIAVAGVYKNRVLYTWAVFIGLETPIARGYFYLADLDTGRTRVLGYQDLLAGKTVEINKDFEQGLLFINKDRAGRTIRVLDSDFQLADKRKVNMKGYGEVELYIYQTPDREFLLPTLVYADTGEKLTLIAFTPGWQNYQVNVVPRGDAANTPAYLKLVEERAEKGATSPGWDNISPPVQSNNGGGEASTPPATPTPPLAQSGGQNSAQPPAGSSGSDSYPLTTIGGAALLVLLMLVGFVAIKRKSRGAPLPPPPPPPPS